VGETIRHALSTILMRNEIHDAALAAHNITVTEVRMSVDLRHATIFVTPLGGGDVKPVLAELKRCKPMLRTALAQVIKMRYAPELHFQPDESFDYADSIERALKQDPIVARDIKQ
jgi:ribosome-binding factor A